MEPQAAQHHLRRYRWVLVILFIGGLILIAHVTGLGEQLESVERVRTWVQGAGAWGLVLLWALFVIGALIHAPGILFLTAAMFIYPKWDGILIAFAGAVLSVSVSFLVIRLVGGQPLGEIRHPFFRRLLRHLDHRPIRTVFLLRMALWLAPAVSSVLAMSSVRFRDYVIGSALGLAVPVLAFGMFFEVVQRAGWLSGFQ
jgi:uncharacterized membrane protein YdjX (TVP38/TMEM64 family)